jgi:hypothetical protein
MRNVKHMVQAIQRPWLGQAHNKADGDTRLRRFLNALLYTPGAVPSVVFNPPPLVK